MAHPPASGRERLGDRYLLLDMLGSGGMATVWRAWDERLEVFRAVKILGGALAGKTRTRQRLEREARVMAQLRHPNIVTLHELAQDGERLYLVMELLVGGSLMERVTRDGPLPPRMAVQVMDGVLAALVLAHDHGVVHRDVKPHNVLLDGDGTPKVTDFGIARMDAAAEMTRTGAVLGTLAYMPPEQKLSARKVDARSDLYAVGGTLFCLLTGREPFDLYVAGMDATLAETFFASVPPALVPVIRRATAFRMEDRFASAQEMADALRRAAATLSEDPPGRPLVDPEKVARARATASLGPTLAAETGVDEPTRVDSAGSPPAPLASRTYDSDAQRTPAPAAETVPFLRGGEGRPLAPITTSGIDDDPTPPPLPSDPPRPALVGRRGVRALGLGLLLLLLLFGLGTAGLLTAGFALLSRDPVALTPAPAPEPMPEPVPVAEPVPVPVPDPTSVPPSPLASTRPVPPRLPQPHPVPAPTAPSPVPIVPVPAPEPAVAVVDLVLVPVPDPVPPPVPVPVPVPPSPRAGGWNVQVVGTGRLEPDVFAVLQADADVTDRAGKPGRPSIVVACTRGKLRVSLRAGVASVEPILAENTLALQQAALRYADSAGEEDTKMVFDPGLPSELVFPKPYERWVRRMAASPSISLTYAPFAAAPVTARFTSTGADSMVAEMVRHCGFR